MSPTITISKARAKLPALSKQMIETLEIQGDRELMLALRQGIKEAKRGKGISWTSARKGLGA